jgi:hypothetical protein
VNSIVISNVVSQYAPEGKALLSSTALHPLSDQEALIEISKFWSIAPSEFECIKRYEIKSALPAFKPGHKGARSAQVSESVFIAGDYLTAGSQNGALLSGRLAATESLAN